MSEGGTKLQYIGDSVFGKATSVQAPQPIQDYFEVSIVSGGENNFIGVGLSSEGFNLER